MTQELEEKLWSSRVETPSEWEDVARYLVARLASFLDQPIAGRAHVSATLQLFLLGTRLTALPHPSSTVELSFERAPGAFGSWRCSGWQRDEYGEWEDVEPL